MEKERRKRIEDSLNPAFDKAFKSESRDLFLFGGSNAGKSYTAAQKAILKCSQVPNRKFVIVRRFTPSLKLTCWDIILKIIKQWEIDVEIRQGDLTITFPNGSIMLFLPIVTSTGEPAERIKSLTDVTDIWFEEPTELTKKEYRQARMRLRGGELKDTYAQAIHTFNPIDQNHWLKTDYKDKAKGEWQKYTYKDNPYIDEEERKDIEAAKIDDPAWYRIYGQGNWGIFENIIFRNWRAEEFELNFNNIDEVIAGADFGWEHPNAWALLAIRERTCYIIDEIRKRKQTKPEFADAINSKQEIWEARPPTYCDSSEPASIVDLERGGLWVYPADKSKNSVLDGISLMQKFDIVVHPRCTATIREFQSYSRREDRHGDVLEEPMKINDDLMCAIRYALYTHFKDQIDVKEDQYDAEVEHEDEYAKEGRF